MTDHLTELEELEKDIRETARDAARIQTYSTPSERRRMVEWSDRLSAAIALMRGQSWQDIATAPKDGSYVLVANSHGSWIAKWHPVYQTGYRPSNPWASMMLNHDHIEKPGRFDKPTHWQPLPTPPKDAADEQ